MMKNEDISCKHVWIQEKGLLDVYSLKECPGETMFLNYSCQGCFSGFKGMFFGRVGSVGISFGRFSRGVVGFESCALAFSAGSRK